MSSPVTPPSSLPAAIATLNVGTAAQPLLISAPLETIKAVQALITERNTCQAALAKTRSALVGLDLYTTERCGDYLGSPAHTRVSDALAIAVAASTTKRHLEGGAA